MTHLCAATNTTLDDYYDWSIPRVKREMVNTNLDSLNNNYSKQLHGFIESCLEETEERRPSMEEHKKFLDTYQTEISNRTLDFRKVRNV